MTVLSWTIKIIYHQIYYHKMICYTSYPIGQIDNINLWDIVNEMFFFVNLKGVKDKES